MMKTGGRFPMRSMTAYLRSIGAFAIIEEMLSIVCKQSHIAFFNPMTNMTEEVFKTRSMGKHGDHVGCNRLVANIGSNSSYLEWSRGEERVRVDYSGPSYQVVGGIHSNFYDFGGIVHQSVNCDVKSCREIIVLSFALDSTKEPNITPASVARFVDFIKDL